MISSNLDFYFDFMSPYAYLAHVRLPGIARKFGFDLRYHPLDLVRTKLAAGNNGPSNRAIPRKIAYLKQDFGRWANRYGVPIQTPKSHDSELANLGALVAADEGKVTAYANEIWKHSWGQGGDFTLADIAIVVDALALPVESFLERLQSQTIRERYERINLDAQARGVFGVPTVMIGEEMWWGNDRLDFLEEYLSTTSTAALKFAAQPNNQVDI